MRRMHSDPLCGSASPRPLDIAVLPETRGLAEAAAAAGLTQTCNDATRRKFTKTLAAQLPSLLSCWREERRSQLIGSLSCMATVTCLCSQDLLGLAIAIFKCRECSAGLCWAGILSHSHVYVDQSQHKAVAGIQRWVMGQSSAVAPCQTMCMTVLSGSTLANTPNGPCPVWTNKGRSCSKSMLRVVATRLQQMLMNWIM